MPRPVKCFVMLASSSGLFAKNIPPFLIHRPPFKPHHAVQSALVCLLLSFDAREHLNMPVSASSRHFPRGENV